jgi:hypothetical protein
MLVVKHYDLILSFIFLHSRILLALILLVFIILSISILAITTATFLFILTISKLVVVVFNSFLSFFALYQVSVPLLSTSTRSFGSLFVECSGLGICRSLTVLEVAN